MPDRNKAWHLLPKWAKKRYAEWRTTQGRPGLGENDAYYWWLVETGDKILVSPRSATGEAKGKNYRADSITEFRGRAGGIVSRYLKESLGK